jgi:hypothetical protein
MGTRGRWRQVGWFALLYLGGVLAVALVAAAFRLLMPR